MSKNNMAGLNQKHRQPGTRSISKQDQRLTGRHIKALVELEEKTQQNGTLKTKLDVLEKELSSCYELHEIARKSKRTIEELSQKHFEEIKELEEKLKSAKDVEVAYLKEKKKQEENEFRIIKEKLETEVKKLKTENQGLEEELRNLMSSVVSKQKIEQKCSDLTSSLAEAQETISQKSSREKELEKELLVIKSLNAEVAGDSEKYRLISISLENKVEEEKRLNRKLCDQNFAFKELSQLSTTNKELKEALEEKEKTLETLLEEKENMERQLKEEKSKRTLIEMERDTLQQSADDLRSEFEFLKNQMEKLKLSNTKSAQKGTMLNSDSKGRELKGRNNWSHSSKRKVSSHES